MVGSANGSRDDDIHRQGRGDDSAEESLRRGVSLFATSKDSTRDLLARIAEWRIDVNLEVSRRTSEDGIWEVSAPY